MGRIVQHKKAEGGAIMPQAAFPDPGNRKITMTPIDPSQDFIEAFQPLADDAAGLLVKLRVSLPDRPGSLAALATAIAETGANITFFHYDRSVDSSRVAVEARLGRAGDLELFKRSIAGQHAETGTAAAIEEVQVTSADSVLEIKVRLENRPGTLAAFARLLADHDANVIYMLYDEDIDPLAASIAMATKDAAEIDLLLRSMNEQRYHYSVVYRGADEKATANIIGLKLVEKFFLRLKSILPESGVEEVRSLVRSSQELEQDLLRFATEAGNHLEAGEVFEKVLTFASRSRTWTGDRFHARLMPPLNVDGVELLGLRMPTSENVYLFRHDGQMTMIDAGHGIYYDDLKRWLRERGFDPAEITRIFVTHPDTDHAGMSGYFEAEFGTEVFLHPGAEEVIKDRNRAIGATGSLLNLNKYYTRLSERFTECRFPSRPRWFETGAQGELGGFRVLGDFRVGPHDLLILESHGGHTPGLVFFLDKEHGLLFTSDFLIDVPSLQPGERDHLGIYRYLLTNPNRDSAVYRKETQALKELILSIDDDLRRHGGGATILPGHGSYYPAGKLRP
jgi:glyoxylase-like metal-dependent hydrolase (beta-lactamase superfamily II)/uncharacterized protein with ACT and thioredoxin-like domain